jgi:elongation factor P
VGLITTSEFKAGVVIKYNNDLFEIIDFQLVKMQQRQPIVRTKLKSITNGNFLEQPFRSGEKFDEVYLEDRPIQFLYREGEKFHFMDSQSFNEVVMSSKTLGEQANFLQENMEITGRYDEDKLILVELPASVVLEVKQTDPGLRGDTAKSGSKPATLETGATVKVPLFVSTGDKIRVDTRTGQYLERA